MRHGGLRNAEKSIFQDFKRRESGYCFMVFILVLNERDLMIKH